MNPQTGVFIVGGGPAGLAAAIALRGKGLPVTVADHGRPPIDKTCGEGLMPNSVAALGRLGVTLSPDQTYPFRGIRFVGGGGVSVDAAFPHGSGIGVRRTFLHQALIARAEQTGVKLLWGTSVKGLSARGVELDGGPVECRWVIGADGENSRVRQWAGLESVRSESVRFGFRRHYRIAPWTDCMEIYWGSGCQVYLTPVSREEICAVVISRDPRLRLDHVLPNFPELHARLKSAPATPERGAVSATRRLAHIDRGRVILAGDASGSVDAITGEGLRLGFEQGMALADALAAGSVEAYRAAHHRLARRPHLMAGLMLLLDRSDRLRRRALDALSSEPKLFATQLAMHVGAASAADLVWNSLLPLGRNILASSAPLL